MDIQTATVVIAGISVIIGVMNSIISSRRAEEQRQTEIQTHPGFEHWHLPKGFKKSCI